MAKKPTKSSRRNRAKKEQVSTKKKEQALQPIVLAEGSNEPVVKTPSTKKRAKPIQHAVEAEVQRLEAASSAEEVLRPPRNRMLINVAALAIVIIVLISGAIIIRQQGSDRNTETTKSGQSSARADEILQSGGKVCTNDQAVSDTRGSTNPQSVGMQLQANPTNNIQTPQTFGGGSNDAMALQGAACF